jgi:hypothetical protein
MRKALPFLLLSGSTVYPPKAGKRLNGNWSRSRTDIPNRCEPSKKERRGSDPNRTESALFELFRQEHERAEQKRQRRLVRRRLRSYST